MTSPEYNTCVPYARWSTDLDQPAACPPLGTSDLLLVPTQESIPPAQRAALHTLNLIDGSLRWQRTFEYALVSGLATVQTSGILALVSVYSTDLLRGHGALKALNPAGGTCWCWAPGVQRVSAPALACSDDVSHSAGRATEVVTMNPVDDLMDLACVTADARTLVVLDLATGEERTRVELGASASLSAPAVVGDVAYVPCRRPHLMAVGLDGRPHWHFEAGDSPEAWLDKTPLAVGEHLFAVLTTGAVLALRVADGALVWRASVGPAGKPLSPPATDGERLFVGAHDGLHVLALDDGTELWTFPGPRRVTAAPVVTGGVVYATCHDHHLYALDTATGQELWRHQVGRRIEVPPILARCGESATPCAFVVDRGGTVTAVVRPFSAAEHQAAGRWVEAASIYAALGQFDHGAELLEGHGEPLRAAELWEEAGDQERAATQYEAGGAWQRAAGLWAALGRPLKQAGAVEAHARSLEDKCCSDEERAAAWASAGEIFEAEGEKVRAAACQRQVARWLRQPLIVLDVQLDRGLVLGAWSRLRFIVRNEGYGPARNLIVRATGDQFEGQVTATRQIATLRTGRERVDWLDVCPRAYGDSVPLRVSVEYEGWAQESCICEHTLYIPVARVEAARASGQVFQISTAGGAVIVGDVAVTGGDFVGRDAHTPGAGAAPPSSSPATTGDLEPGCKD